MYFVKSLSIFTKKIKNNKESFNIVRYMVSHQRIVSLSSNTFDVLKQLENDIFVPLKATDTGQLVKASTN